MSARKKTAEIITLLYEATQGPHEPFEMPALNPTGGVHAKQDPNPSFRHDPKRPGGGVFVLQTKPPADYEKLPGVVHGDDESSQSSVDASQDSVPYQNGSSLPMSTMTQDPESRMRTRQTNNDALAALSDFGNLPAFAGNMNPTLNVANSGPMYANGNNIQVMNMLDGHQPHNLEQVAQVETGFLEGIPGGMFDWGNSTREDKRFRSY